MLAARRSSKVSMKHQQQPVPGVVLQLVPVSLQIPQIEGNRRFSRKIFHAVDSALSGTT
jgi:hypothetical protein